MAAAKVGTLIKEARLKADLTQEQLARKIAGVSAEDISLAERNKKSLTQTQLKQIAKITGVTQASLLNAAKGSASKASGTAKKAGASSSKATFKVTATEKKLIELYRAASSEDQKAALKLLKGESASAENILETLLDSVQDMISGK